MARFSSACLPNGQRFLAYVISGCFAAVAGIIFASKYGQVNIVAGTGYEMSAIAACVIGGISLTGGLGDAIGAMIGAVIMSSITKILVFLGLSSDYNNTITGIMLITIVVVDALAQRRSVENARRKKGSRHELRPRLRLKPRGGR